MNKPLFQIALALGLQLSLAASAQQPKAVQPQTQSSQIALRVPNFARGLVARWVAEYRKTNPNIDFQFVTGKSHNQENSILLTTDADGVQVARLAVLPVTVKGSEAERLVGSRALNAKRLQQLFFVSDDLDEDQEQPTAARQLHIVTGNSQQSASRLYARSFHQTTVNYRGKKVSGDDSFLNLAISRDPLSVTVSSLPDIFDLESRQLRPSLALLPLDVDKQGRQVLSGGRLDDILQLLEREHYDEIPVGSIGFEYSHANPVLTSFVQWVLQNGTQYVHQYGLLALPQKELTAQQRRLGQKDLAQKTIDTKL